MFRSHSLSLHLSLKIFNKKETTLTGLVIIKKSNFFFKDVCPNDRLPGYIGFESLDSALSGFVCPYCFADLMERPWVGFFALSFPSWSVATLNHFCNEPWFSVSVSNWDVGRPGRAPSGCWGPASTLGSPLCAFAWSISTCYESAGERFSSEAPDLMGGNV